MCAAFAAASRATARILSGVYDVMVREFSGFVKTDATAPSSQTFMIEIGRGVAPAKLNLILRVLGRRADGYHILRMLNVGLDLQDEIVLTESDEGGDSISVEYSELCAQRMGSCEQAALLDPAKNSMGRAVGAFRKAFGLRCGVQIKALKRIPSQAGLGGGSSDAALVLALLSNRYLGAEWAARHQRQVLDIATSLGADVPYFLSGKAAWVEGVGEVVTPLVSNPLAGREIVLIIPAFGCSTPKVYEQLRGSPVPSHAELPAEAISPSSWVINGRLQQRFIEAMGNDLEGSASQVAPQLRELLSSLRGVGGGLSQLTGSGSTIFVMPIDSSEFTLKARRELESLASEYDCGILSQRILG